MRERERTPAIIVRVKCVAIFVLTNIFLISVDLAWTSEFRSAVSATIMMKVGNRKQELREFD